jgi:serine/threonine protein kinase
MNLQDWVKKTHPFADQLEVIEGVCVAVEEAIRVQHGMLSPDPSRIDVAGNLEVRVRAANSADATSLYTAPEIREGRAPRPNADVFSAGVIFYEMLAQRHPFQGDPGGGDVALQPPPLRDVRPELPRDLTDAITACLERDPEWRPSDLAYLLQVVRGLKGTKAAKAPAAPKPRPVASPPPEPRRSEGGSEPRRGPSSSRAPSAPILSAATRRPGRPTPLPIVLVAILVLLGAGYWFLRKPSTEATPVASPRIAPTTTLPQGLPSSEPSPEAPEIVTGGRRGPSPSPRESPSARPSAEPTPSTDGPRFILASPTTLPPPTMAAVPTPPPTLAPVVQETPPPTTQPPAATSVAPAEPAAISAVSPRLLRRGQTTILDVHGTGLKADHRARFSRPKEATASGINISRVRYVNTTLVQVLLQVDPGASAGPCSLILVDAQGQETNPLGLEVQK